MRYLPFSHEISDVTVKGSQLYELKPLLFAVPCVMVYTGSTLFAC